MLRYIPLHFSSRVMASKDLMASIDDAGFFATFDDAGLDDAGRFATIAKRAGQDLVPVKW